MTPTTRLPLVAITADDIRSLYTHESSIYSTAWELKDDLEEAAALIEKQGSVIDDISKALEAIVREETVSVHTGYDNGAGGGNFVYTDAVLTDSEAFANARRILAAKTLGERE